MSNLEAGQILDADKQGVKPDPSITGGTGPVEEKLSPKLSVLMERERQAVNRERMAKAQEDKTREALLKIEAFENLKKDRSKVEDVLKEMGWDYDKLTQARLQDGAVPPGVEIQQLRDEIVKLKDQLQAEKNQEAEKLKKQAQDSETQAVQSFKSEISEYLKGNAERYDLIDFEGAHDLVYDVVEEHYNRTINPETQIGEVMSIADACDRVEKHLEQKYQKARERNKVKALWNTIPKPIQEQLEKQKINSQPPKTLTNNLGPKISEKTSRLPEDQRVSRIVAEFEAKRRNQYAG